jgi:hypothetical protein
MAPVIKTVECRSQPGSWCRCVVDVDVDVDVDIVAEKRT